MRHTFALPIIIAFGAAACGNDNGGDNVDAGLKDSGVDMCTLQPTFTSIHDELLVTATCNASGCHNNPGIGDPGGSLSFAKGKDAAYMELLNDPTFDPGAGLMRVKAGDAQNSFLYRKLTEDTPPGSGGRMPLLCDVVMNCLPTCQTDQIKAWINAGAQNN